MSHRNKNPQNECNTLKLKRKFGTVANATLYIQVQAEALQVRSKQMIENDYGERKRD